MLYSAVLVALNSCLSYASANDVVSREEDCGLIGKKGCFRRMIKHIRTTLINLQTDNLTLEEIMYFQDTWMEIFNEMGVAGGYRELPVLLPKKVFDPLWSTRS
jgi:trehalose-6-phosphatase